MPLKHEVDSLDGVDEKFHALYVESDGKYRLDPDVREDVSGLKSALEKERELRAEYEKKAEKFTGVDLEEYNAWKREQAENRDKEMIDSGKVNELIESKLAERDAFYKDELSKRDQAIDRLTSDNRKYTFTDRLHKTVLEAGAEANALDDIEFRAEKFGWTVKDGEPVAVDNEGVIKTIDGVALKGEDGLKKWALYLRGNSGSHLFGTNSGGGGTPGSGGGGGEKGRILDMTDAEKAEYLKTIGIEKYNAQVTAEVKAKNKG